MIEPTPSFRGPSVAREPEMPYPRAVVMDFGLAASRRPEMTVRPMCFLTPRPRARRRARAPHGRRRQGAHPHRRRDHSRARAGAAHAAMRERSSSTPTAIRRASPIPGCRWSPTTCRISPVRSPAFSPGSIGRRRMRRRSTDVVERAGRLSVPAARSGRRACTAARAAAGMPLACARSGEWRHPVVGLWPVGCATICARAGRGRPAQDRGLDRAPRRRHRRLAGGAGRSVLQRQHAGGCRRGRAHRGAALRPLSA